MTDVSLLLAAFATMFLIMGILIKMLRWKRLQIAHPCYFVGIVQNERSCGHYAIALGLAAAFCDMTALIIAFINTIF